MHCFSSVAVGGGGGITFCRVLCLALFCDEALTGETAHFVELLFIMIHLAYYLKH